MKNIKKLLLIFALAMPLAACEESANNQDQGFPVIYIPQATYTGLDNSYPIPRGDLNQTTNYACRYDKETGNLDIVIGVVRAGYLKEQKAFEVDLKASHDVAQIKLDEYEEKNIPAAELSEGLCTIPAKISVEAGKNSATTYVSVNLKELSKQQASIFVGDSYKLLVLGLEISNPTEYELAEKNTSVVIILDLNDSNWDTVNPENPLSSVRTLFPII